MGCKSGRIKEWMGGEFSGIMITESDHGDEVCSPEMGIWALLKPRRCAQMSQVQSQNRHDQSQNGRNNSSARFLQPMLRLLYDAVSLRNDENQRRTR